MQGEERGRKRRKEIDLNIVCDTDVVRVDEEHECKRMKCSSGMLWCNGSGECQGVGGDYNNSIFSGDTSSVDVEKGVKLTQRKVVSYNGENLLESEFPNLELSLGTEKRLAKQGAVSLFPETVNKNKDQHSSAVTIDGNDDCSRSLTLSLAMPVPIKEQQGLHSKPLLPGWHGVDTSLSLFGGLGNS